MAHYAIRGLDLAGDSTEDLARFLMVADVYDVTVRITRARGPNGYPVATFYSFNLEDMAAVLLDYCDNDDRELANYMEMVTLEKLVNL